MNRVGVCIWCREEKTLTEEHVIPDNIGGTMTAYCACRSCNNDVNNLVEQRATCDVLFTMPRYVYGIKGRRGVPRNPFAGKGRLKSGEPMLLTDDFRPIVLPRIEAEETDRGTVLKLSLDMSQMDKSKRIAYREVKKILLNKYPDLTPSDLEVKIEEALQTTTMVENTRSGESIIRKFQSNMHNIMLLFLKIAYEIASLEYGAEYVESSVIACRLREGILSRSIPDDLIGDIDSEPLEKLMSDAEKHYYILIEDKCLIKLFGLQFVVQVTDGSKFRVPVQCAELVTITPSKGKPVKTNLVHNFVDEVIK
ncbi:MAG: hypothetical protein KAW14_03420 [Candidatus Aegiribacteria sp.]|nr:hypothetical protein [Candidatus Aegiribacteria sp.]